MTGGGGKIIVSDDVVTYQCFVDLRPVSVLLQHPSVVPLTEHTGRRAKSCVDR